MNMQQKVMPVIKQDLGVLHPLMADILLHHSARLLCECYWFFYSFLSQSNSGKKFLVIPLTSNQRAMLQRITSLLWEAWSISQDLVESLQSTTPVYGDYLNDAPLRFTKG